MLVCLVTVSVRVILSLILRGWLAVRCTLSDSVILSEAVRDGVFPGTAESVRVKLSPSDLGKSTTRPSESVSVILSVAVLGRDLLEVVVSDSVTESLTDLGCPTVLLILSVRVTESASALG
jgi:hypothetical protein